LIKSQCACLNDLFALDFYIIYFANALIKKQQINPIQNAQPKQTCTYFSLKERSFSLSPLSAFSVFQVA